MKFLNNLMIRAVIPFENHPEAQPEDQIKLTANDMEYLRQTEQDILLNDYKNRDLYLVVQFVTDEVLLGDLHIEIDLVVKTGCFEFRDYYKENNNE